jgi:hypothetical protein
MIWFYVIVIQSRSACSFVDYEILLMDKLFILIIIAAESSLDVDWLMNTRLLNIDKMVLIIYYYCFILWLIFIMIKIFKVIYFTIKLIFI